MFSRTMTEQVVIDRVLSFDEFSEPVYADPPAPETFTAWINRNPRELRSATAQERGTGTGTLATHVYLAGRVESNGSITPMESVATITPEDRLTLPDGSQLPILTVGELRDPGGDYHVRLVC